MGLRIQAELGGDGTGYERMMTKAGVTANRFASTAIAPLKNLIAGAFSIGAIESMTRGTIQFASHLRDISDELGVNVEWLQEMQFVMKQNGGTADDLAKFINHLARAREAALSNPKGKEAGAFSKFGISTTEIQSGKIADLVSKFEAAFQSGVQQNLEPAFHAIGGKGAAILIPSFIDGLQKGRQAARDSGAVMAEDTIDQLDEIDDFFSRLSIQLKSGFAPVILNVIEWFNKLSEKLRLATTWAGAFFSSLDIGGFLKGFGRTITGQETDAGQSGVQGNLNQALATAAAAVRDHADEIKKEGEAAKKATDARKALRHKRENANIEMTPLTPEKEKFKFAKNSDALTSIGNFLGGSGVGSDLVSIGERTNQLLSQIATNTRPINATGGGSGVPEE